MENQINSYSNSTTNFNKILKSYLIEELKELAFSEDYIAQIESIFGTGSYSNWQQAWQEERLVLPKIEIRSPEEINGARGAYSSDTNKIYLSQEFISQNQNDLATIFTVFLEEYGHFLDAQDGLDAQGDEGELFAALVLGKSLTDKQIKALKQENDQVLVTLDGQQIIIEQAAGDLDTSFDTDGVVTTPIGNGEDVGRSVVIQADGKIVVAGYGFNGTNNDFAVVRYLSNGTLDTSFDTDGKLTTAIGTGHDEAKNVALQTDGKIVVIGSSNNGSNNDFAVVRYNSDGSLDTTFDTDGKLTTDIGANVDEPYSVAIQADGKIVVAGSSNNGSNLDITLVRYNSDGSLDTTFDTDGKLTTAIGSGDDVAASLALQANGKIVIAGYSHNGSNLDIAAVRYNSDGSLDTTFDTDGKVTTAISTGDESAAKVVIQADGKIVVAGADANGSYTNTPTDIALARYNSDGSLDTTFDTDGILTTAIGALSDAATSVAIDANGKILAAGGSFSSLTNNNFAVVRYNSDGTLDTTFDGQDGKITNNFGVNDDVIYDLALQPDGMIVVAGRGNSDFTTARYQGTLNQAPTDISINNSSIAENQPSGTAVGNFSTTDPDVGNTFIYSLVSGTGDTDNTAFTITSNQLLTNASFNYEIKNNYSIRLRTTDSGGLSYEKAIAINVTDVNETPVVNAATFNLAKNSANAVGVGTLIASDPDANTVFSNWQIIAGNTDVDGDNNPAFAIASNTGKITVNDSDDLSFNAAINAFNLQVSVSDGTNVSANSSVTVNLTANNQAPILNSNYLVNNSYLPALDPFDNNFNNFVGNTVAEIVTNGSITDGDGTAIEAIAVTNADNTNGTWQYSLDNGGNWLNFNNPTDSTARLLDSSNKIRFVPNNNYSGKSTFTFRAWDKTNGAVGEIADSTNNGGATAFSSDTDTAETTIAISTSPNLNSKNLFWQNSVTGQNGVWFVDNTTLFGGNFINSNPLPWKMVAIGDFNSDAKPDIVWRNSDTGENTIWYMNGSNLIGTANVLTLNDSSKWEITGTGDFNNDGKTELVWRSINGENALWYMTDVNNDNNFTIDEINTTIENPYLPTYSNYLSESSKLDWKLTATGEFNNDGKTDLLWRNNLTGENLIWYMNDTSLLGENYLQQVSDLNWDITGTGDFNNDGKTDIVWRNSATGENALWYMDNNNLLAGVFLTPEPDLNWQMIV